MSRWLPACLAGLLSLGLSACGAKPQPSGPPATRLDRMSLDDLPASITGSLAGSDFTGAEVRYRVETFSGRERVDLLISDTPLRRCGLPIVRQGRIAWLRFMGRTTLPSGEVRRSTDEQAPAFSIHYEDRADGDRVYVGREGGDALVSFGEPELGRVAGKLFACFGDGQGSCIKGSFVATPCFSRIDGRAVREGVGLEDEALEPPRAGEGERATTPSAGGGDSEGSREAQPARLEPTPSVAAEQELTP